MSSSLELVPMDKFDWFLKKANIEFKQHQYDGVQWCVHNETRDDLPTSARGGFIADEMGLGKTITMIAVMITNFKFKTLIVLPNVLIDQWIHEIYRTTGHIPLLFYGANKKNITIEDIIKAPIVITSYNTISISKKNIGDKSKYTLLHKIKWNRLVFDEAHHLRNRNSHFYGASKICAPIRWLISGTPIQNKRSDFLNLCASIQLPKQFYNNPNNVPSIVKNYLLRRTKAQAGIALPLLEINNSSVLWHTDFERILSEDIHEAIHWNPKHKLRLFIKARQVCILPKMLLNNIHQLVDDDIIPDEHDHTNALQCSSKMDAVIDVLLSRHGNGNGKLVFCHFRYEIDTIVSRLLKAGITNAATFDGRTAHTSRAEKLAHGYEYLVLQIQTGCEGLNLQANFNEVYFVSPHWNPAIEEQAIARCHRIGQTKPVHVFRFQMNTYDKTDKNSLKTSLDQYISSVQSNKREISNQILEI